MLEGVFSSPHFLFDFCIQASPVKFVAESFDIVCEAP